MNWKFLNIFLFVCFACLKKRLNEKIWTTHPSALKFHMNGKLIRLSSQKFKSENILKSTKPWSWRVLGNLFYFFLHNSRKYTTRILRHEESIFSFFLYFLVTFTVWVQLHAAIFLIGLVCFAEWIINKWIFVSFFLFVHLKAGFKNIMNIKFSIKINSRNFQFLVTPFFIRNNWWNLLNLPLILRK